MSSGAAETQDLLSLPARLGWAKPPLTSKGDPESSQAWLSRSAPPAALLRRTPHLRALCSPRRWGSQEHGGGLGVALSVHGRAGCLYGCVCMCSHGWHPEGPPQAARRCQPAPRHILTRRATLTPAAQGATFQPAEGRIYKSGVGNATFLGSTRFQGASGDAHRRSTSRPADRATVGPSGWP